MPTVVPISKGEFLHLLQKCMPPGGWPRRIAVANSAGPDSSCLLYLMSSLAQRTSKTHGLPSEVWSIHVNHKLQAVNSTMAQRASSMAESLGVPHYTVSIPWGQKPFPPKPQHGEPIEEIARAARQNRLLHGLLQVQARCIAFGHHADDQVETAIMRIIMGSGELGIAGMKPVRRWGMGSGSGLDAAGLAGMNHWIIRPLLDVSKDRILATCEAHNLDYVTDMTNFQPSLTLRNRVRHHLSQRERHFADSSSPLNTQRSSDGQEQIDSAIERLSLYSRGNGRLADLREAVRQAGSHMNEVEMQASYALDSCILPSPPSTLLLSRPRLDAIPHPAVRQELVRRVLRCVSPRPWGAPAAVAGGSRAKLALLVRRVWETSGDSHAFSLGGRVRWRPVVVRADGAVRMDRPLQPGEYGAWLVTRDSPWSPQRVTSDDEPESATVDCTDSILGAQGQQEHNIQLLYDARFCIEIELDRVPEDVYKSLADPIVRGRIMIKPDSKWWLPKVVWQRKDLPDEVLGQYAFTQKDQRWTVDRTPLELDVVPWIHMYFVRSLQAL